MGSGQWPGHMVRQEGSGNLAYKRDVHMGHTALWELEGCIKVGHVDAHQNSFPGLEGEWNHRQISPCALLRQPPASKKLSGYGVSAAMWDWLTLDTLFLYTLMHKMPVRTVLSASKKKGRDCRWLCGRFPVVTALNICGKLSGSPGWLCWLGARLFLPSGRGKCSECCKRTGTEDRAPIWMAELHFFRVRNILLQPIMSSG